MGRRATGRTPTVVTFASAPARRATATRSSSCRSLERRLELLEEAGMEDALAVEFTLGAGGAGSRRSSRSSTSARSAPRSSWPAPTSASGGRARRPEPARQLGFDVRPVPLVEGVSSTHIRQLLRAGEIAAAARLLGRPAEVEGTVVAGDARGGTLGFPDREPRGAARAARAGVRDLRRGRRRATGPPSRSASTRTTAGASAGSRRSSSTSRATSTGVGSWSSSGGGCARSARSQARPSWSPDRAGRRGDARGRRPERSPEARKLHESASCALSGSISTWRQLDS